MITDLGEEEVKGVEARYSASHFLILMRADGPAREARITARLSHLEIPPKLVP